MIPDADLPSGGYDYDIAIIGGGIHGAGVAQAAQAAGYRAVVLEKTALAAGTSSRSSKLIHGGLRYLESLQFALVRESLTERRRLLSNAPSLVHAAHFYIPIYRTTHRRPWQLRTGLTLYALLAGLSPHARFSTVPHAQWDQLDGLDTTSLQQVFRYTDAQTDDAALTRAVMASATALGATLLCPAQMIAAHRQDHGYLVHYQHEQTHKTLRCRVLINAAGPWANHVLLDIQPSAHGVNIDLVQGTHLVLEQAPVRGVYYLEAPRDHRAIFVMPWQGHTLLGTTEHLYHGDPDDVGTRPDEIDYLLETYCHYFPAHPPAVLSTMAGLRVLPQAVQSRSTDTSFHRSRETLLHIDPAHPRLITIYGGKLTVYRATAEKLIRLARPLLGHRQPVADTRYLRLEAVIS